MGYFSWITCDTNKNIRIDRQINLLCPDDTIISDSEYDGYGRVNGRDVYYLNLIWNRQHIIQNYNRNDIRKLMTESLFSIEMNLDDFFDSSIPDSYFYEHEEEKTDRLRLLMIAIIYTKDEYLRQMNKYPLKFVEDIKNNNYSKYTKSEDDPNQGYF